MSLYVVILVSYSVLVSGSDQMREAMAARAGIAIAKTAMLVPLSYIYMIV
ncbi:MAG: hypothetical protein II627_05525 [Lachnospiraceae bacterium]|nr:hypothetical protein [Lachnospiraceae bacterium]